MSLRNHRKRNILLTLLLLAVEVVILSSLLKSTREAHLESQHKLADINAENYADTIERAVEHASEVTDILAYSIVNTDGDTSFFQEEAAELYNSNEPLNSIQIAPDGVVTDIYPMAGNEEGTIDLIHDEVRGPVVRYGRDNHLLTIQGPFQLKQGGSGLAVRTPVYLKDGTFWGDTIVIIDTDQLVYSTVQSMKKSGYSFAIEKTNPLNSTDATTIVSSGSMDSPETSSFIYGSCFWKISIEPENGWTAGDTFFRLAVAGGIIVVLIAVLFYLLLYNKDRQNYLNHIASIDYLTGLSSRQALETSFQKYYEEHPEEPYVGIMIDIDNFKQVNDLYGHEAGDHALQALADHISTAFSGDNIRGRFGGDEFFVILKNTTLEHAEETVRTFTEKKISYYTKEGKKTFTISAGYAAYPEQTDDHNQVINLADDALYAGKIDGKHTCMAYRPGMHSSLSRRELGMNMKDLTSCIPIPFIICESGGGFTILASDLEMVRYLGYQDDADMMNWLGNSIQPLLRKEDLELLTSHRFHNGDRISVTMKSGSVRQPQLYCRPYRHEVFGNILILFFIDQDFQKKREEESRSASEKGV